MPLSPDDHGKMDDNVSPDNRVNILLLIPPFVIVVRRCPFNPAMIVHMDAPAPDKDVLTFIRTLTRPE